MTPMMKRLRNTSLTLSAGALSLAATVAHADQVILDDLIVDGSICAGLDCVNGESFGFDTLRLKENNLRIKFQDTSASASFPSNDWQITANDSSNGGANKFSIDDIDGGRTPFTIEASAPSHSLYVDDGGRIGFGKNTPVVELHVADGDSPTLRLEQDGTSGFTPQTWDLAGNETNFFVRDVTNGSSLPFRIRPGNGNDDAIVIAANGDVGMGTDSPTSGLHLVDPNRTGPSLLVQDTDGRAEIWLNDGSTGDDLKLELRQDLDAFNITFDGTGGAELIVFKAGNVEVGRGDLEVTNGNLTVSGTVTVGGSVVHPDYVFAPDYELMPLYEVEKFILENSHLPKIPSAAEVQANGLNMTEMQIALLEKVEELTLYTLEQQKTIDSLQQRLDVLATK